MVDVSVWDEGVDHVDVVVVGAGISGIAAAHALSCGRIGGTFLVVDALDGPGGTWRLHRYPGVRSDSDMFTYGFRFKPWTGAPIASGAEILAYLGEAIDENRLRAHFRYGWRILSADWNSRTHLWRLEGMQGPEQRPFRITCRFLWMCSGYYRHARGYIPEWPGMAEYDGRVVHPQTWPEGLVLDGQRAIVIGSGATAATLVPALASKCEHVTMLQRSPTYFSLAENRDAMADTLRKLQVDSETVHEILRRKITFDEHMYIKHVAENPEEARAELLLALEEWLSKAEIDAHFSPTYLPWQQRLAVTPGADLFRVLKSGRASIVTDEIQMFTKTGVQLKSGATLDGDLVITATGFDLAPFGDIDVCIDGNPLNIAQTYTYRGCMFTGVPNFSRTNGYLRVSSWTLRAELISVFVVRLLNHMDALGASGVEVRVGPFGEEASRGTDFNLAPFNASYLVRSLHLMPRSAPAADWQEQAYWIEKDTFPAIDLSSETFAYTDANGAAIGSRRLVQSGQ